MARSRGRCAEHNIAFSGEGRCLLCDRRSSSAPEGLRGSPGSSSRTALIFAGLTVVATALAFFGLMQRFQTSKAITSSGAVMDQENSVSSEPGAREEAPLGEAPPREGELVAKNRSGRSGYFYLPAVEGKAVPVLVLFHGQGGAGAQLASTFRSLAEAKGFAIVAPDSGFVPEAGFYTWYARNNQHEESPDTPHILASIRELMMKAESARPPVTLARVGWLAAGHSAGGSSAAALATNDPRFSHFAVLHGGAFPDGFGTNLPDGWFSTGEEDALRTPAHVRAQARAAARVIGDTRARVKIFAGGHAISPSEAGAMIDFWLSGG